MSYKPTMSRRRLSKPPGGKFSILASTKIQVNVIERLIGPSRRSI